MNNRICISAVSLAFAIAVGLFHSAAIAGSFVNLDFEQGISGWTAEVGGAPTSVVVDPFHGVVFDYAEIALFTPGIQTDYAPYIQGTYALYMPSTNGGIAPIIASSISQTGLVPANTNSIQFLLDPLAEFGVDPDFPVVALNGSVIPLQIKSINAQNEYTFGGDVRSYAGQTEDLSFTSENIDQGYILDSIGFSTIVVPEPSLAAAAAVFSLLCCCRRPQGRKRSL